MRQHLTKLRPIWHHFQFKLIRCSRSQCSALHLCLWHRERKDILELMSCHEMLVQLIWYGFHLLMFQLNCLLVWLASAIYVCNMRAKKEALLRPNCIHVDVATFSFYVIPVGVVSIPIIYAIAIGFSKQIKSCLMHLHVASFRIGLQVSVSFTEMKLSLNRKTAKNIRLATNVFHFNLYDCHTQQYNWFLCVQRSPKSVVIITWTTSGCVIAVSVYLLLTAKVQLKWGDSRCFCTHLDLKTVLPRCEWMWLTTKTVIIFFTEPRVWYNNDGFWPFPNYF